MIFAEEMTLEQRESLTQEIMKQNGERVTAIFVKEAVKRMTPMHPKAMTSGHFGSCPCCGSLVSEHELNNAIAVRNCKYCGQALDWS